MFQRRIVKPAVIGSAPISAPVFAQSADDSACADNSVGFSATIRELAEALPDDVAFDSGSVKEAKNLRLRELRLRVEQWENSRVDVDTEAMEWDW
jgi:hypothetical protein